MNRRWLNLFFFLLLGLIGALFWHLLVYANTTAAASLIIGILKPLNILLFLALFFVIVRNLVKLYTGRKAQRTGFRLRTKLVLSILPLTLTPGLIIFFMATSFSDDMLVNLVIDSNVGRIVEQSETLSRQYLDEIHDLQVSHGGTVLRLHATDSEQKLRDYLNQHHLAGVEVVQGDRLQARILADEGDMRLRLRAEESFQRKQFYLARETESGDIPGPYRDGLLLLRFRYELGDQYADFLFAKETPFTQRFLYIRDSYAYLRYTQKETDQVRGLNNSILLVTTMVVIFLGIWIGMAFSKNFLAVINQLITAAEDVSRGRLDTQINLKSGDELDQVAGAFNTMTATLSKNRAELQQKTHDLEEINAELTGHIQYSQAILEKSSAGLISTDDSGCIRTYNPAAERILGAVNLAEGAPLSDVLDEKQHRALLKEWNTHQTRGFETVNSQVELSDSRQQMTRYVSLSIVALKNDEQRYGALLVLEDLTQLLNAQKVAAWREVAKRVAHEIKNPLTPIQLSIQRIRRKAQNSKPDLPQAIESAYETIMSETNLLKNLVNEFSTFAKLPEPVKEELRLDDLIRSVVESYAPVYPELTVGSDIGDGTWEWVGDPVQLRQVLTNLIQNAAQASQAGGSIVVVLRRGASGPRLSVEDLGIGVPDEEKDKLFVPYYSKSPKGTGLGLAIVKRIIEDHGGTIWVEDNQPRGTKLVIDLPAV